MNKELNYNIVFLRFLAIIIVVFGHSIIIYDNSWGLYTTQNPSIILSYIKHLINIIQMPIWFCISGYLFYSKKTKTFSSVFFNKLKKLILPFFTFGFLYLIPIRYFVHYNNYITHSILYNIFQNLILGYDNGHLWYLPTLFFIFLLFSLLFYYKNNNKFFYCLILFILLICNLISYHFHSYVFHILHYAIFFYLGFLFHKNSVTPKRKIWILLPYLIFLIIYNFFSFHSCFDNIFILLLQLILVYLLFIIDFKKYAQISFISEIANQSYGIYLFHSPLVYITFSYFTNIHPIIMIFINFILFGSISFLATKIIRSTKLKWIFGE